jgi:hypothetical protein
VKERALTVLCALVAAGLVACGSPASPRAPASPVPTTGASTVPAAGPLACPASVGPSETPSNVDAPTDRLVPGSPASGRVCRYHPLLGPSQPGYPHGALEGQAALGAAPAQGLAAILNAMGPPAPGPTSCPADFDTIDLLMFSFTARPPLTVRASVSGCPTFTNGAFVASGATQFSAYAGVVDGLVPRHDQLP